MYDAPASRRPLPHVGAIGEQRGPWMAEVKPGDLGRQPALRQADGLAALRQQCERSRATAMGQGGSNALQRPSSSRSVASSAASSMMAPPAARLDMRRKPVLAAPWESLAVQEFASKLRNSAAIEAGIAPSAMMLQGPGGNTVLAAVGEQADHKVAGRVIADLQTGPQSLKQPSQPTTKLVQVGPGQQAPLVRQQVSFGAVYEHRNMAGKAKFVSSTSVVPERQFQLDWQDQAAVKTLAKDSGPGASGHLVWVGVGSGPVGEQEMKRVRQAVVDARSERLGIEKLGSEKPYSRHF